jgi:spore coat polysaccharide biosynthesis predicted glycosyltransferase SpsG
LGRQVFDEVRKVRTVVIIASASSKTGAGHVARQYEVARELQANDFKVVFVGDIADNWRARIQRDGASTLLAPPSITALDFLTLLKDLKLPPKSTWIIRDNYSLEPNFDEEVSGVFPHYVIFDDLPTPYQVYEILVNQGVPWSSRDQLGGRRLNSGFEILGAEAAVVRSELHRLRDESAKSDLPRRNGCLISFGSSDPGDFSYKVWEMIPRILDDRSEFCLGPFYEGALRVSYSEYLRRVSRPADPLGHQYFTSKFAIGAAGVSAYERAFCGLPSINFTVVPNQMGVASILQESGASIQLEALNIESLSSAVHTLSNFDTWTAIEQAGLELVDGRGAARLVTAILERT